MMRLLTEKFVWHGIRKDSLEWARTCVPCQTSKVSWHTESGVGEFPQPKRRFGHIHVDVVGPLPPSEGARYLLTIIDRSTKWPEVTPMSEATTKACTEALLTSWISRFGVPDEITKDRGPVFLSELWTALARLMGTLLHATTANNPAANGMVERFHRSLKASLMARCTGEDWKSQLPWVLLGLRTAPRANSEASPAEKVYGEPLTVPGEFFPTNADDADISITRLWESAGKFTPCIKTVSD
ncbi:protein NYNRIN-like [Macrobrachium nipponense]|uniref:protein NYNRIN-like n=1 Tax=Macrobrachium nipponense TaxID=159736 RepID=UPI0030C885D3